MDAKIFAITALAIAMLAGFAAVHAEDMGAGVGADMSVKADIAAGHGNDANASIETGAKANMPPAFGEERRELKKEVANAIGRDRKDIKVDVREKIGKEAHAENETARTFIQQHAQARNQSIGDFLRSLFSRQEKAEIHQEVKTIKEQAKANNETPQEFVKQQAEARNQSILGFLAGLFRRKEGKENNTGSLVSTIEQVRSEQFRITKEILRKENYTGSMDEFAQAYNEATKALKDEIKAKIAAGNSSDLNARVVGKLAEDRLIQARIEIFAKLNITNENVTEELEKRIEGRGKAEALSAEINGANSDFTLRVYAIMKNGTPEEQAALKAQLEAYANSINGTVNKIEIREVDASNIRQRLNKNERLLEVSNDGTATAVTGTEQ